MFIDIHILISPYHHITPLAALHQLGINIEIAIGGSNSTLDTV